MHTNTQGWPNQQASHLPPCTHPACSMCTAGGSVDEHCTRCCSGICTWEPMHHPHCWWTGTMLCKDAVVKNHTRHMKILKECAKHDQQYNAQLYTPQARIRTAPTTPSHTKALQHTSQPDSPTGHWFQHTTKATPRSGHVSSGTPKRNAQDLDRILQRVSTLVAPAPIDPHADEPRETVLPPALAAQFSPLARSATQLLVHYSAGAGTGTASGAASTSACAPPAAVGPCAEDALCGVYIPPWQGGDEEDGTPFAYGSPLARGASGGGVAHAQGPFGAFQEAYRPAAVSLMRRLFGRA